MMTRTEITYRVKHGHSDVQMLSLEEKLLANLLLDLNTVGSRSAH